MQGRILAIIFSFLYACVCFSLEPNADQETRFTYTLEECLQIGLGRDLELINRGYDVELAHERMVEQQGVYDPRLSLTTIYEDSELPSRRTPIEGASTTLSAEARLAKVLGTGTVVEFAGGSRRFGFPGSLSSSDPIYIQSLSLFLSQPILRNAWGRLDQRRIDRTYQQKTVAKLRYYDQQDTLAGRIHHAYWNAYGAKRLYEVHQRALARSEHLLEINRKKVTDGLLEETDLLAAEADLATKQLDVYVRRDTALTTQDLLKELLSVPKAEWDAVGFLFPTNSFLLGMPRDRIDGSSAFRKALSYRADLLAAREGAKQAQILIAIRKQEGRPELSIQSGLGQGDAADDFDDSLNNDKTVWSFGLRLEIPWRRQQEKSRIQQAELELIQALNRVETLKDDIRLACITTAREFQTSIERVKAARKALDLQTKKLKLEEEKFLRGRSTTQQIIEYQDDVEFAESSFFIAESLFKQTDARYRLAQGVLIAERDFDKLLQDPVENVE